ncbi:MAG: hypothetical protein IKZ49_00840, partial [Alphaproteobacteria bacterium]|nr:hypothetical protein [Alphaproteobacteria bacterium]
MKKVAICSLLVGCCLVNSANAGTVTEACYATSHCGARGSILWSLGGGFIGAGIGNAAGGALFGAFGAGAGTVAGAYAGIKLGGKIGASYSANEYIYFDDGTCLECDDHQIGEDYECPNGSVVTNGDKVYRCKTTFTGDYWESYTIPVCVDSPIKPSNYKEYSKYKTILKDNITNNGKSVKSGVAVYSGAVCVYVTGERDDPTPPTPTPSNKCEDQYKGNAEAIACCKYKYSDWKDGKCVCQNKKAEWKYNSKKGTGFCKVPGQPDPNPVVPDDPTKTKKCKYTFNADMQCANGARITKNTEYYLDVDENKSCEAFKKEFGSDQAFMLMLYDKYCSEQGPVYVPTQPQGNEQAFKEASASLQGFFQSAKNDANVWKNAD